MLNLEMIHKDERGEIYLIKGDLKEHQELTLFVTNKDYARGGCVHNEHDEYCIVLEGSLEYYIGKAIIQLRKGDVEVILSKVPHYFISKTDSIVIEWGADPEEKKKKHHEFRQRMEEVNAKLKKR